MLAYSYYVCIVHVLVLVYRPSIMQSLSTLWAQITMGLSSAEEKWMIEKLNGANWSTCKFQTKCLLQNFGDWWTDRKRLLKTTGTAPSEFQERSKKALNTLELAISTSHCTW